MAIGNGRFRKIKYPDFITKKYQEIKLNQELF